jgi:hypothetical protein
VYMHQLPVILGKRILLVFSHLTIYEQSFSGHKQFKKNL